MQKYEETVPREVREKMTDSVVGRKTIDKLVDERRFEKERQRKVRLIKEGIRRKFFQQGSGPNDILNFGMYEGWRFGDVYICHPTYGEWAVEQTKPKMWKLKCFKFFLMRLADLDRVLQREESVEQINITRVEMCEGLMEEMAAEEQQAVQESRMIRKQGCRKVGKHGIRRADMEESQIEIGEKKRLEESHEDSGTSVERWVSYDMAVEEHEAVMQREEEMKEEAEMNREKTHILVPERDREIKKKEWDWEDMTEDGLTREALEQRRSKGLECQKDGDRKTGKGGRDDREKGGTERQEEGSKERQEEGVTERQEGGGTEWQEEGGKGEEGKVSGSGWQDDRCERQDEGGNGIVQRRQDDGQDERGKGFRWQDDDDKRQMEKLADAVRRQLVDDRRQDGKMAWIGIWMLGKRRMREVESWDKIVNE